MNQDLRHYYFKKILKALNYLEFTYEKVKNLPTDPQVLTNEQLEIWDGFVARFARLSDIFLSKYIKAAVKADDPAFDGVFRDYLNRAEKMALINTIEPWLEIRELRNVMVHEYNDEDLKLLFEKMLLHTPLLIELKVKLANANQGK